MSDSKFTIAVIGGTGDLGQGLTLRWAKAGHRIIVGSRNAEKAHETAKQANVRLGTDLVSGGANDAAAKAADIIAVAVPYNHHAANLEALREASQGKIVIDVTVPLRPPKVRTVQLPQAGCAAKETQDTLGDNVRVVSAFQNVAASHLQDLDHPIDCDVLVCGNDADACEVVIELAKDAGMKAWHAGRIENSAIAEALTSGLIFMNAKYKIDGAGIRITGAVKSV
jgi:8-hydroxy-5-deazaflavin:NADPH oxidoreductase